MIAPSDQLNYKTKSLIEQKELAASWFKLLRDKICSEFEQIEAEYSDTGKGNQPTEFTYTPWDRSSGGGGEIGLMKGRVFEKVGVNISSVWGEFSPEFRKQIPGCEQDPRFWASGISLVAHMRSPFIPAAHMNTRFITTSRSWFGGGGDLTPTFASEPDTVDFHNGFKKVCDQYNPDYYHNFKKQCDEYFFLPHRNEPRGVGGIFYDYLNTGDWDKDFGFTKQVGLAFLESFAEIIRRNLHKTWTDEEREKLLIKRGRYVEFNLLYDRGTKFGLMTNGNPDAILISMPPEAKWP